MFDSGKGVSDFQGSREDNSDIRDGATVRGRVRDYINVCMHAFGSTASQEIGWGDRNTIREYHGNCRWQLNHASMAGDSRVHNGMQSWAVE